MYRKDAGSGVLIAVVGILIIAILALLGGTYWNNARQEAAAHITDFASCKADAGSRIQESYPETCVTSDGRSFTGPTDNAVLPDEKTKTYCVTGEKLCFKYPESWVITKSSQGKADRVTVASADKTLTLQFTSGIYGIGGTCATEDRINVHVLESTEIPKMKGFKDTKYAYSLDMLRVARVVVPKDDKYVPTLYVASDSQYTNVSVLRACGIYFSNLVKARNVDLGSATDDPKEHGSFSFGFVGDEPTYDSLKEAKAAYSSTVYQQGAAILTSLYYK